MFVPRRDRIALVAVLAASLPAAIGSAALGQELPACSGGSSGLVLSVSPAANGARIERAGTSGSLQDLSLLCPGDRVVLDAGETALVEVQGARSAQEPLQGPVTYEVPSGPGMLDNASTAVARLIFSDSSARTRTLVSRSAGGAMSPRPANLGVRLPQELAYRAEPRALWFGWSGGAAPFHVTLEDADGTVLAEADVTAAQEAVILARHTTADGVVDAAPYDVTLAPLRLAPGGYRFRVFDANSEPPQVAALMRDQDAGVLSLPLVVVEGLAGVPSRSPDGAPRSDLDAIVEAICFSEAQPESRLFEAAQHIVAGRGGAPYASSLSLLGADLSAVDQSTLCP
jgi:hypothetical protein